MRVGLLDGGSTGSKTVVRLVENLLEADRGRFSFFLRGSMKLYTGLELGLCSIYALYMVLVFGLK